MKRLLALFLMCATPVLAQTNTTNRIGWHPASHSEIYAASSSNNSAVLTPSLTPGLSVLSVFTTTNFFAPSGSLTLDGATDGPPISGNGTQFMATNYFPVFTNSTIFAMARIPAWASGYGLAAMFVNSNAVDASFVQGGGGTLVLSAAISSTGTNGLAVQVTGGAKFGVGGTLYFGGGNGAHVLGSMGRMTLTILEIKQ